MDKKSEIQFNLNNFLLAISTALDFVSNDVNGTQINHNKRIAYIALNIANEMEFSFEEKSDLCSYSLANNIALIKEHDNKKEYLEESQKIVNSFPFLTNHKDVLKYQLECFNGSGVYGKSKNDINKLSQVLSFSIYLNEQFELTDNSIKNKKNIEDNIEQNKNILFDEKLCNVFLNLSKRISFYLDLKNENEMLHFIFSNLFDYTKIVKLEKLYEITKNITVLTKNVNLLKYVERMLNYYDLDYKDKYMFLIAFTLNDLGKFFISQKIIKKREKLTDEEYEEIKSYPYYNKKILSNIISFDDIASLVSKCQEKINGNGYPFSCSGKDLSFKDRLFSALAAYLSLRGTTDYRTSYNHEEAIAFLLNIEGLDKTIITDVSNNINN